MSDAACAAALADTQTDFGSSRASELSRCRRAHSLRYHYGLARAVVEPSEDDDFDPDKPDALRVGGLTHAGLRYVYEGVIAGEERIATDVIDYVERAPAQATASTEEARRLLEFYFARWGARGWGDTVKIVACEELIEAPELMATARADLVIEVGERIVVVDTKTRARALPKNRSRYARQLRTREQFVRLSWLARRHYGLDYAPAVMVDAVVKTKIPQADRLLVTFTAADLAQWEDNQRALAVGYVADIGVPPMSIPLNYRECAPEIGSPCWAFDFCHGTPDDRAKLYQIRTSKEAPTP